MAGLSGDEYANVRSGIAGLVEWLEGKRDSAKAAATHYPSTAQKLLGEADAYDDAADGLAEFLKTLPK